MLNDPEMVERVEDLHRLAGQATAAAYGLPARRAAGLPHNLQNLPVMVFLAAVDEFQTKFWKDVGDNP